MTLAILTTSLPLLIFTFAGLFSPGPNVVMLTASGARFGFRATVPHLLGVPVGVGIIAAITGTGVGAALVAAPSLTLAFKITAALWILRLAWKTAQAGRAGRSDDLLKLKQLSDAEATVIGYRPGKGQYAGMTGSLKVRNDDGIVFYVGSGLSLEQRADPPPISGRITYRYQGFTKNGVPRFAVFLRVRNETPLQ